jgi:ribosomal protein S10
MVKQLIISNNISFLWLFKIDFFKSQVINFISVHVNRLFNKIKLFGLPTKTSKFRVLRSPHVNKKSMESFYIVRSKYFSNSFNLNGLEVVRKLSDLIEMFMKFLSLTSIKTKSIIFKM